MKKFILFIPLLLLTFLLKANPIDIEDAKKFALNFYSFYAPTEITDFSIKEVYTHTYNNNASFYTVVFNAGGFVLISADDNAKPILAYSFTGKIKKEISNTSILYKFENFSKQIEHARTIKAKSQEIEEEWNNLKYKKLKSGTKAAGPLLKTTWDQSPIYNMYCPTNTPAGCVAIAMSQIMKYHEWPVRGQGYNSYIPSSHPEYGKQFADFSSVAYDWSNMVDNLTSSNSDIEKQAVATLIYHCAVSVNMNFGPSGSGAISSDVMQSLSNYFLYDNSTLEFISFNVNQQTDWISKVKKEIDNNRPVYYSGGSEADGGHAWVCDGYDNSDRLHINWGWSGDYNGYFEASAMSPGQYDFSEYNYIIIGIKPGNPSQDMLWSPQASGFATASRGIRYISAIDKRTAWAVAYDGSSNNTHVMEYTRTANGGTTWNSGSITLENTTDYDVSMICAVDYETAWIPIFGPNGGGKIIKTTDGGKTWVHQSSATFAASDGFPNVIHFWDKNNGFCAGDPNGGYFEIYSTTTGGDTWTRVPEANIPANLTNETGIIAYYDVVGDTAWFATTKGRIFRSIDKGLNWQAFQTPISNASFQMSFKNSKIGIIQTRRDNSTDSTAYITNNGGETWTLLNHTGNFYTNSFRFIRGSNMLISTGSDSQTPFKGVSYSTDNGSTFTDFADFYKNFQFLTIGSAGIDGIWAGGFNSSQYKNGMWHFGDKPLSSWLSSDEEQYCITDHVLITDESVGNPDSWSWNFGEGANPATATSKGPHTIDYSSEGHKTITLTTTKNGENHQIEFKNLFHVASGMPASPGTITGSTTVNARQKYTFSVTANPNVSFNWIMPTAQWQGTVSGNSVQIFFASTAKGDTLKVTAENGCGVSEVSKLAIKVRGSLGIEDLSKSDPYILYPNPACNYIYLKNIKKSEIQIYNNDGKMVLDNNINSELEEINISSLPAGIYYLKFIVDDKPIYKPFSKQ